MSNVTMIGLDIAKAVFHAHGADASGNQIFSRRLSRGKLLEFREPQPRCLIAMEACSGAHHWAREFVAIGHEVRLIPPAYVEAVRNASEERCRRCRSDWRGCSAPEHALRRGQERGAAGCGHGVSYA